MLRPFITSPRRQGAMDPALKRLLVLTMMLVVAIQFALHLFDFDYPVNDPYGRARAKIALGKIDEAERIYRLQAFNNPDDPRAWLGLGELLVARGLPGALTEAESDFQNAAFGPPQDQGHALSAKPERLIALRELGLVAALRGQDALSERSLQQATAGGDLLALRSLALEDVVSGRRGADSLLQQAVMRDPGDAALLYCVATGWQLNGHPQQATAVLRALGTGTDARAGRDHWAAYCRARYLNVCGDQPLAARTLSHASGADAAHLDWAMPLTRAQVAADPAFQVTAPVLAAVIAAWQRDAPWADAHTAAPPVSPSR